MPRPPFRILATADGAARRARRPRAGAVAGLALVLVALVPASGQAAMTTFGSPLSAPATMDTAANLNYAGARTSRHDGADTVLWNIAQAAGSPAAPADGQILSVKLEGCAQPANGGPTPLTQIHFQDLVPQGGGAVKVNVTTQPFDVPVCGQAGANGTTVSTYQPTNFCVRQGDYVDFNDEGGFNPIYYPSGVPFQVIGSVSGSTMDSFIGNNQTNNGDTLSPSATGPTNGFATNSNEELMLQATLGSGPDATPLCPGGTAGQKQPAGGGGGGGGGQGGGGGAGGGGAPSQGAAVTIGSQTDGINHRRIVKLALLCAQSAPCTGTVTLMSGAKVLGTHALNVPGHKRSHVSVRLSAGATRLVRRHHRRLGATLRVTLSSGQTFAGRIRLKV